MHLRLRDLDTISGDKVISEEIMRDVVGFKKYWFFKKALFRVAASRAMDLIGKARETDISKLGYNEKGRIKKPDHIDHIAFQAMMQLENIISNSNMESNMVDTMTLVIATACYQKNINEHFDSDGEEFSNFRKQILDESMYDMVGLFNHICGEYGDSQLKWKKLFMSVEIPNAEMEEAGAGRMNQFRVLTTIKTMCDEFNCSYDEAWQMSYELTQTNSYAKATYAHIHENLRILKEHKMRAEKSARHS